MNWLLITNQDLALSAPQGATVTCVRVPLPALRGSPRLWHLRPEAHASGEYLPPRWGSEAVS